jgi:hypothetical protein
MTTRWDWTEALYLFCRHGSQRTCRAPIFGAMFKGGGQEWPPYSCTGSCDAQWLIENPCSGGLKARPRTEESVLRYG